MLILPPGHYQEISRQRVRTGRERWLIRTGALMVAIIVAVTLFSLTSHRPANGGGCVSFTYTMAMGGEEFHTCGQRAQRLCASPPKLGGLGHGFEARLRVACREAKIAPPATS